MALRLNLRLDTAQKELLARAAKAQHMSVSEFVRRCVMTEVSRVFDGAPVSSLPPAKPADE